jgi:hypothetical protein
MNMSKMTVIDDQHSEGHISGITVDVNDADGIGARFLEGFNHFIHSKKEEAVLDLLNEEFPHLADDENFVQQVVNKLDPTCVAEKRFVFLVLNPNLRK